MLLSQVPYRARVITTEDAPEMPVRVVWPMILRHDLENRKIGQVGRGAGDREARERDDDCRPSPSLASRQSSTSMLSVGKHDNHVQHALGGSPSDLSICRQEVSDCLTWLPPTHRVFFSWVGGWVASLFVCFLPSRRQLKRRKA